MQCSSAISGALIGNSSWRDTELEKQEEEHNTIILHLILYFGWIF